MPARQRSAQGSRAFRATRDYAREARKIGLRIRGLREARGFTLEKLDERTGLNFRHLAKAEAGQLNMTLATMLRIARGLRVPVSALFVEPEGD